MFSHRQSVTSDTPHREQRLLLVYVRNRSALIPVRKRKMSSCVRLNVRSESDWIYRPVSPEISRAQVEFIVVRFLVVV